MKIKFVAWNCRMALQNKIDSVQPFSPDIAVFAECAKLENYPSEWVGLNKNKGLGVYSFNPNLHLKRHDSYRDDYYYFLPVTVTGSARFNILAVWAFNKGKIPGNKLLKGDPVRTPKAIDHYLKQFLQNKDVPAIIAGDFNNSIVWDRPDKKTNFIHLHQKFTDHGFRSAYHTANSCDLGKEPHPTHINKGKAYHIDYTYITPQFELTSSTVGKNLHGSDHYSMQVELVLR